MRPTPTRPAHEATDCPRWCRRDHHPDDAVDDLLHQSDPTFVVVVHGDPRFGTDEDPRPDRVVLRLVQRGGTASVWLEAASEEGRSLHLLVSAESARRLVGAMGAALSVL